jgi:inosine triphosphate pyrophosphatase
MRTIDLLFCLLLVPSVSSLSSSSSSSSNNDAAFRQLRIAFVTGNAMKANEMNKILAEHGVTRGPTPETSLVDLRVLTVDLPEIQEADTIAIAKDKVLLATQLAGGPALVEDTSLEFTALGGMPGPYIKFFQERLQSQGLYNILAAYEDKSATAVCTLAFCPAPHADPVLFTGKCHGQIVAPIKGGGFGWDCIFLPDGADVTFSRMTVQEKNKLSHRGKAVRQWADWLGKNQDPLWERQEGIQLLPGHKGLDFKPDFSEQ